MTIVVPRGAEAAAVRRARPSSRVIEVPAGARAATGLPTFEDDDTVVVLGLCGALHGGSVGDVVVYRRVVDDGASYQLDAGVRDALASSLGANVVAACTANHVVTTLAERSALASRYNATVVDMEGTHLAAALATRGVRLAMVRIVSDDDSCDLPALERAIGADGSIDVVRIATAFVRSPRAAYAFIRNVRHALRRLTEIAPVVIRGSPFDFAQADDGGSSTGSE
ncbi:MAG: nucleosidase [Candidatus Eremiobacteraeota bacterium]|nr:nucleosidase [Candidatus Eremiobacteraeota bacterium]